MLKINFFSNYFRCFFVLREKYISIELVHAIGITIPVEALNYLAGFYRLFGLPSPNRGVNSVIDTLD